MDKGIMELLFFLRYSRASPSDFTSAQMKGNSCLLYVLKICRKACSSPAEILINTYQIKVFSYYSACRGEAGSFKITSKHAFLFRGDSKNTKIVTRSPTAAILVFTGTLFLRYNLIIIVPYVFYSAGFFHFRCGVR